MQKKPFIILGLEENATMAEVNDAYTSLKKKYSNERFLEGEVGHQATKKLAELENAYEDCKEILNSRVVVENFGSAFGIVEKNIKNGALEEAQQELDNIETRDAEWHYFQSIIYYKKNWYTESKKQLQIAIALDDANQKYKTSLQKLEEVINQNDHFANAGNNANNANASRAGYSDPNQRNVSQRDQCCNGCGLLCCADTCCECMGGDCISCC